MLSLAVLVTGCAQQSTPSPSSDAARETSEETRNAANVVFSSPGLHESPNGKLSVEIKRHSQGYVTYHPRHQKGPGIGPTYRLSEEELVMCWDDQGRLWTYHPTEFVHYHHAEERRLNRVFVGTGGEVRDEMPVAFLESLPKDIERMAEKAKMDGVWHLPQPQEPTSEPGDTRELPIAREPDG